MEAGGTGTGSSGVVSDDSVRLQRASERLQALVVSSGGFFACWVPDWTGGRSDRPIDPFVRTVVLRGHVPTSTSTPRPTQPINRIE